MLDKLSIQTIYINLKKNSFLISSRIDMLAERDELGELSYSESMEFDSLIEESNILAHSLMMLEVVLGEDVPEVKQ